MKRSRRKRNRRAGVDDLWTKTVRDPDGNTRTVPSARHGRGMRWRARYVDDRATSTPKRSRARLTRRHGWTTRSPAKLATGTYVTPQAGRVTVGAVYASWSASQGHISRKTAATRGARGTRVSRSGVTSPWSM